MSRNTSKEKRKRILVLFFIWKKNDQYLKIKVSDSKVIIIRFVRFIFILFYVHLNVQMNLSDFKANINRVRDLIWFLLDKLCKKNIELIKCKSSSSKFEHNSMRHWRKIKSFLRKFAFHFWQVNEFISFLS